MTTTRASKPEQRVPLSRERVLGAAVALVDESGLEALTMRRLAERVGAEAMSLYYHVPNKDQLLDGIVEVVAAEINDAVDRLDLPSKGAAWKSAVRARILAARQVLLRHPWAPGLFENRSTSNFAVVRYHDGLIGLMRDGGFSHDLAHHALHALGSRAIGFSQELFSPAGASQQPAPTEEMAAQLPHIMAMLAEVAHDDPGSTIGWCDDQTEFEFGLDLILDGLDRLRERG